MVLALLQLPWIGRPVQFDEANFLTLARGAAADPWRPHDIPINWQGTTERAFAVLSNPPGIGWWLAPLTGAPIWAQRLWMLPWLALAAFGAAKLARRFGGEAVVLLTAPIVLLSTTALLPDAPLYALTLAGVGGFVSAIDRERPAWGWALLAGCAALFRYSGITLWPVLVLYPLLRRRSPIEAFAAGVPLGLLALHDVFAYGEIHLLAMGKFQSVSNTPLDWFHKGVSALCMLGGAAALPIFPWGATALVGAGVGAALGSPWGVPGALFGAAGGASLAEGLRRRDWLAAWALVGTLFLLTLRFTATRYWLPFLPALLLARPARGTTALIVVQVVLGAALLTDDQEYGGAVTKLADEVAAKGTGGFTGHWGWQWAMESRGWTALDLESHPAAGSLVAMPREAWPQELDFACARPLWSANAEPRWTWLPRAYTHAGQANLHANFVVGPVRTVAPWWFAADPYEHVDLCRVP